MAIAAGKQQEPEQGMPLHQQGASPTTPTHGRGVGRVAGAGCPWRQKESPGDGVNRHRGSCVRRQKDDSAGVTWPVASDLGSGFHTRTSSHRAIFVPLSLTCDERTVT